MRTLLQNYNAKNPPKLEQVSALETWRLKMFRKLQSFNTPRSKAIRKTTSPRKLSKMQP